MLASLFNIPSKKTDFDEFSFANMDHHRQIFSAIFKQYGVNLQLYPIDPIPLNDFGSWAYNHQLMHDEQNNVLGIVGNDLTTVDFSQPEQVANYTYLHGQEHLQAESKLIQLGVWSVV